MKTIFIGGTGRSGTTILKRILARHECIVALRDEFRVIIDPGGALDLVQALSDRWSPYNADAAVHQFLRLMAENSRSASALGVALEKIERRCFRFLGVAPRRYLGGGLGIGFDRRYLHQRLQRLVSELCHRVVNGNWGGSPPLQFHGKIYEAGPLPKPQAESILAAFFNDLYQTIARDGQTHWLDDTPYNLLHAHELIELFPGMRLIHIYRDPRDVMSSYFGFSWGGGNFLSIARRLAGIYARWFDVRRLLPPESFLEVSLEKLSADPLPGLMEICDFLCLDYDEKMAEVVLDKVHAGRWTQNVPPDVWQAAEPYLAEFMEAYGYQ